MEYKKLTNKNGKSTWVNIANAILIEPTPDCLLGHQTTQIIYESSIIIEVKETPEEILGTFRSN